ncbi:HET-domain-containing protein [Hyaloscypha variabilis F]|uniref:HET-domain-containing protein n=1 Tax=Hyaloscypha variabilis (strain UAMH 11265 / GT02V1 / F) TaxID=1149755 RepID=A0A2J6QT53_HYAVF|nr:HET-domain-containing protein [Hyaloscypha variabilis F]
MASFTPTEGICATCSRMTIESLTSLDGFLHTYERLASKSCPLCMSLFRWVSTADKPIRLKISQHTNQQIYSDTGFPEWALMLKSESEIWDVMKLVATQEGDPAAAQYGIRALRSITSSGSQETLSIAKSWLGHCIENHNCHQRLFMPRDLETPSPDMADANDDLRNFYPTRLLGLQAFGSGCLDIRPIEEPVAGNSFATLSHCWGVDYDTRYQTTTRTLCDHRDRILYANLPKTYLDAVIVCRSLSIRYLWIDSLCIIQDSPEDWAREAASMSDVYSNSHLTISADWSPNPEGGCFKSINAPPAFNPENTICLANVLSSGQQSCCFYLPTWDLDCHSLLDSTHLAGRAWAFQERLLSRRNLHFTQHQLFWECREGFAGEDGVPRAHKNLKPNKILDMRSKKELENQLATWCEVVETYSSAKLTFPTDRLPALSALARFFAEDLRSPYLAGLWLEGLWYTLLWYNPEHESVGRTKDYIAPSWSWCSINTGIRFLVFHPSSYLHKRIKILDAVVESIGDTFGQVFRGWIRFKGKVADNLLPLRAPQNTSEYSIYPDHPREPPPSNLYWLLLGENISNPNFYFLILIVSPTAQGSYERWGVGRTKVGSVLNLLQERTITII